jgi:hypothetical protein
MHFTPRSAPALAVLAAAVLTTAAACSGSTGTTSAGGTTAAGATSASASAAGAPSSASAAASTQDTGAATSASGGAGSPSASPGYPVDLQPATAAPGGQVAVYGLTCSASTGTATSSAFTGKVALSMLSNATGGIATVKAGLAAGSYPVTVVCGDITVTGTLTVS